MRPTVDRAARVLALALAVGWFACSSQRGPAEPPCATCSSSDLDLCPRPPGPAPTSTSVAIIPEHRIGPAPEGPAADLAIADLDGDGSLDIVVSRGVPHELGTLSVLFARGAGWEESVSTADKRSFGDLEIGDLDGDGCLDIVTAVAAIGATSSGGVQIDMAERTPDGRCRLPSSSPKFLAEPHSVLGIGLGDLDGDGRLDIALSRVSSSHYGAEVTQKIRYNRSDFEETLESTVALGAAFTCEVLDADNDGRLDVVVGGKSARRPGSLSDASAFALLLLSTPSGVREVVLRTDCGDHCKRPELPEVFDLEVLPRSEDAAQFAVARTTEHCHGDPICLARAIVQVYQLPAAMPAGSHALTLEDSWPGSEPESSARCTGALTTLEAARVGPGPREPALIFGVPTGMTQTAPGDLVIVRGLGPVPAREHHLRGVYHAFAMGVADLDRSHTTSVVYKETLPGRLVVALPEPLHHVPEVRCDGATVKFTYAIENLYLTLGAPCSGALEVRYQREDAGDIVFAPKPSGSSAVPPLERLELLDSQ